MSKGRVRKYQIERDEQGMPTKMIWLGDFQKPTKEELDAERLAEYEKVYGKRSAESQSEKEAS